MIWFINCGNESSLIIDTFPCFPHQSLSSLTNESKKSQIKRLRDMWLEFIRVKTIFDPPFKFFKSFERKSSSLQKNFKSVWFFSGYHSTQYQLICNKNTQRLCFLNHKPQISSKSRFKRKTKGSKLSENSLVFCCVRFQARLTVYLLPPREI